MSIETLITICSLLGVVGWLALDWYMGWTSQKLDAAIKEFEEEQGKGVTDPAADLAVFCFGLITVMIVLVMILGRA